MAETATELTLSDLNAGYSGMRVVEDLSFSIRQGQRLGIVGRNGAGKTTTLMAIMGLAEQQGGSISLAGRDISKVQTHERARRGLGYVPQTRDIFASLSVEENLSIAAHDKALLELAYSLFPRLFERRHHNGAHLSGGEQQMLSVARALVTQPKVLLLDEPLEGIAPQLAEEMMERIHRLTNETHVACVLVEQHVDVVMDFADTVLVLERGKALFHGSPAELSNQSALLESAIGIDKLTVKSKAN